MEPILEVVPIPAMVPAPIMVPAPAWNLRKLRLFVSNSDSDSGIGNYLNHNSFIWHAVVEDVRSQNPKEQLPIL